MITLYVEVVCDECKKVKIVYPTGIFTSRELLDLKPAITKRYSKAWGEKRLSKFSVETIIVCRGCLEKETQND